MTTNHDANTATSTTVPSTAIDDESVNLEDYAQTAELPEYAAPVEPSLSFPVIRYAKGVLVVSGKKPSKYTGFHIGIEQDATLDALFEGMGVPAVRVRHKGGNEETYWQLDTLKVYVLATGIPNEYGPDAWQKTGIPYVWNEYANTYAYGSQLQCLFFPKGLLEVGYTTPLILSLSRTVTQVFIARVLRRQEAMIEAVKKALRKRGRAADLAFYAYWMELMKGEEVTTKGGGSYYAPALNMPSPVNVAYVKAHQTPAEHIVIIEEFLPTLPIWAEATSARLLEPPRDNGNIAPQEKDEEDTEE